MYAFPNGVCDKLCLMCPLPCAEAEQCGYEAVMVTVDAPFLGKREADERNK